MRRLILVRVASGVALLLGVSLGCFLLVHLAPGSFVDRLRLEPGIPRETLARLVERFGLQEPWYRQYASWLRAGLRGDLGVSLAFQRPVVELLKDSVGYTLALAVSAQSLALLGGVALGLVSTLRPHGRLDRILSGLALVALSIPTLVLALVALGWAASTGVLPLGGGSSSRLGTLSVGTQVVDFLHHLALPTLVLAVSMGSALYLQARAALLEALPAEFSRAARARGVSSGHLALRHLLRAAWGPIGTYVGSSVPRLLNGAFLVEVVTGWPGMGRLAWQALVARDTFLILGVLLLAAALLLLGNLAADVLVAAADPRIRLEETAPS